MDTVEAFAASWIEIAQEMMENQKNLSKPLRLRGLKYSRCRIGISLTRVEAFAASWIEIPKLSSI